MLKNKYYMNILFIFIILYTIYKLISSLNYIKIYKLSFDILTPFIIAFIIAYLLNPIMNKMENRFNLRRVYSISLLYLFFIGILILGIYVIIPKIISSMGQIVFDMPNHINNSQNWIDSNIIKSKILKKIGLDNYIKYSIDYTINKMSNTIDMFFKNIILKTFHITSFLFKLFIGFIVSIYLLKDKEEFIRKLKLYLVVIFKERRARYIINFAKEVDCVFSRYLVGKLLDSLVVAVMCFVGFIFLGIPYSLLFSVIIGCSNMIPYFGPIIGMIPAVVITFLYFPIKALYVFIFVLIMQQFDGLYLEPKILGDKVGLSPFMIILAIVVGGEVMGVTGMFIGVPIIAVMKHLLDKYIQKKI